MPDHSGTFYGRVIQGHLKLVNREGFAALIQNLDGQEVDVSLRKHRKDRSLPQNSYYWGVVLKYLSNFTGHSAEEIHDAFKQIFLTEHTDDPLPIVRSTTSLDTQEFNEYLEKCVQFAAEKFGLVIPDPE